MYVHAGWISHEETTADNADEGTLDVGALPSGNTTKNLRACGMEIPLLPKFTSKLRPKTIRRKLFFRIAGVAGIPSNCYFFLETLSETQGQEQTQPRGQTLNLFSLM